MTTTDRINEMPASEVSALLADWRGWRLTIQPSRSCNKWSSDARFYADPHTSADTMIVLLEWAAREHGIMVASFYDFVARDWCAWNRPPRVAAHQHAPTFPESTARALLHVAVERGLVVLEGET